MQARKTCYQKPRDWQSPKEKPETYALVELRIAGKKGLFPGWWTGSDWDGRRVQRGDIVEEWRMQRKYYD